MRYISRPDGCPKVAVPSLAKGVSTVRDWIAKYWLGALFGALTGALGWAVGRLRKRQKAQEAEQAAVKEGMLALLHDRIYSSYAECLKKGYASVDDIKNLEYLYNPYHALGGNGTGTELFRRVKRMPTEPPQEATA